MVVDVVPVAVCERQSQGESSARIHLPTFSSLACPLTHKVQQQPNEDRREPDEHRLLMTGVAQVSERGREMGRRGRAREENEEEEEEARWASRQAGRELQVDEMVAESWIMGSFVDGLREETGRQRARKIEDERESSK